MVISLIVGSITHVLAHGPGHGVNLHVGPLDDIRNQLRGAIQVDEIIDADAVSLADRKNLQGRLSFSVSVQLASIQSASEYAIRYPVTLPRAGTIRIVESASTTNLAAAIEDVACVQIGVSVRITYNIVYGSVTW